MNPAPEGDGPEASVIIACYNAMATLPLQLEALSRQQDAPRFEVILSDNGSSEDMLALADAWADRLDIHYVWAGQMPGAGYARNVGMSIARAEKWLFCDADDVVASDWVARGVEVLDVAPVFSGGAIHANDDQLEYSLDRIWARLDRELPGKPPVIVDTPSEWPIIMGGNFGIQRAVALKIGGFDTSMSRGVEDNDLAIRLQKVGIHISAGGTRIVYRRREDPADMWHRSFLAGRWHMVLVERHGLSSRSPELRGRRWMADPLRVIGAGLRNATRGRSGDWPAVCSRAGLSAGLWSGWLQFHLQDRLPGPMVGAGLGGREPDLPADSAVLVLSPHLDDALFSCSELIRRTRPDVWTVFAGDPEPVVTTSWDRSCGFADSHMLVTRRRVEDIAAFEGTGTQIRHLDLIDGAYSSPGRRTADMTSLANAVRFWLVEHADQNPVVVLPVCAGVTASPGVLERATSLVSRLNKLNGQGQRDGGASEEPSESGDPVNAGPDDPGVVTAVMSRVIRELRSFKHRAYQRRRARVQQKGLAVNPDHFAVRDAVLDVTSKTATPSSVRVLLVEDLPYLWSQTGDDEVRRLVDRLGGSAEPHELHVDRNWKFERIARYTSQLEVMDPAHHRLGRPDTIPPVERCWEVAVQKADAKRAA